MKRSREEVLIALSDDTLILPGSPISWECEINNISSVETQEKIAIVFYSDPPTPNVKIEKIKCNIGSVYLQKNIIIWSGIIKPKQVLLIEGVMIVSDKAPINQIITTTVSVNNVRLHEKSITSFNVKVIHS